MSHTPRRQRLSHRILRDTRSLAAFAAEYTARSGHAADPDYLGQAQVRGFFGPDGALRGGYAVAVEEHRYLAALPPGCCPLPPADCVESTHIWIDRGVGAGARIGIYARLLLDVLRTGRRYALGGSTVSKVARVQQQALPLMIYDGPVCIDGVSHRAAIYYGTRWTIVRGFVVGAARRLLGSRSVAARPRPSSSRRARTPPANWGS